jgi:hypothetical protein
MRVIPSSYVIGASHASIIGGVVPVVVVPVVVVPEVVVPVVVVSEVIVPELSDPEPPGSEIVVPELDEISAVLLPPALHPEIMIVRIVHDNKKTMPPMFALLHISDSFSGS